jgi:hypothetical protein
MEVLHIAVPVRSGLDANTQRPDVSNKYMKYTVLYTILIQTLRLRTCNSMRRSIHDEHTGVHTERNAEQHNAAANRPRRAAWRRPAPARGAPAVHDRSSL